MPCLDGGPRLTDVQLISKEELVPYQEKIDKLVRMLCHICSSMEQAQEDNCYNKHDDFHHYTTDEIKEWYEQHKKDDVLRKERLKQSGLAKLTEAEKEALDLL